MISPAPTPGLVEQSCFEIEEITLTGEREATIETELVSEITITGEHHAVDDR